MNELNRDLVITPSMQGDHLTSITEKNLKGTSLKDRGGSSGGFRISSHRSPSVPISDHCYLLGEMVNLTEPPRCKAEVGLCRQKGRNDFYVHHLTL